VKEAKLFLYHIPMNFSVSGALAILHRDRYCPESSSGDFWGILKSKAINFIKENTQRGYKELSELQKSNLQILKYGQSYEDSTLTFHSNKLVEVVDGTQSPYYVMENNDEKNAIDNHLKKKGMHNIGVDCSSESTCPA